MAGSADRIPAALTQKTYPAVTSDSGSVVFTVPANRLPIGVNAVTVSYAGDTNYHKFRAEFLDYVARQLSWLFIPHETGESISCE